MPENIVSPQRPLSKQLPTLRTMGTAFILIFLVWAFFSRRTLQFYASFLFFFYSITKSMWISVIFLGAFQTLLLIPFRIINILKSKHIRDFEATINKETNVETQSFLIRKSAKTGNRIMLYYLIDFFVNVTSYVTIGRLFLTDFYTKRLDPWLLYKFVPYPKYPLQDIWFKIPYPKFLNTRDLGWGTVLLVWLIIFILFSLVTFVQKMIEQKGIKLPPWTTFFKTGSILIVLVISYLVVRNFPSSIGIAILTANISKPFPTLNTITAVATFATLFWLDIPPILKKSELAEQAKIDEAIIRKTQTRLFGESLRSATLVGLGAYFITNHIPCAFELSIFTLEIISWLSPLTLDRLILKVNIK